MSIISNKDQETYQLEKISTVDSATNEDGLGETESDRKLEKRTLVKLDLLLIPMMGVIYLLAFLDRSNIGNARIAGLQKDLDLTDHQYQTAITVTYVPYILAELPSNLVIKKIGPRILLPAMCTLWGIVATLQSLVQNFGGLLACRFFLGLFEGGMFPGIVLYLSSFYRRHELQVRIGLFFSAAAISGAFSGLLAAAIVQMDGLAGLEGWRWIFILEGIFTAAFGVFAGFILPNTAHQVLGMSREQKDCCIRRLRRDTIAVESVAFDLPAMLSTFKSLHVWLVCAALFCNGTSLFGLAYFTPSIVQGLGYEGTAGQLFTVPPFAAAFVLTMASSYIADRHQTRGLMAIGTTCLAIIGFVLFFTGTSTATRYTSLFFLISGVYASAPSLISWIPNNTAAHTRRATAVAMQFIATNIGGIISTWLYPTSAAPDYPFAAKYNLSLACMTIALISAEISLLTWKNRVKSMRRSDLLSGLEQLSVEEQFLVLGDEHPDFRYTL